MCVILNSRCRKICLVVQAAREKRVRSLQMLLQVFPFLSLSLSLARKHTHGPFASFSLSLHTCLYTIHLRSTLSLMPLCQACDAYLIVFCYSICLLSILCLQISPLCRVSKFGSACTTTIFCNMPPFRPTDRPIDLPTVSSLFITFLPIRELAK